MLFDKLSCPLYMHISVNGHILCKMSIWMTAQMIKPLLTRKNIFGLFCCCPQLPACLSPTWPPRRCSLMPCWGTVMGTIAFDTWSWICHWINSSSSFLWACRSFWCPWPLPERFLSVSSTFLLPGVCARITGHQSGTGTAVISQTLELIDWPLAWGLGWWNPGCN